MKTEVVVPEVGESITQGVIAAWLKADGERVTEGEDLFELDTDKATLAVPSPATGALSITVQEGQEVTVGQAVASIDTEDTGGAGAKQKPAKRESVGFEINIDAPQSSTSTASSTAKTAAEPTGKAPPLSPAVRLLIEQHGLDPEAIEGSGKDGRITKADVLALLESSEKAAEQKTTEKPKKEAEPTVSVSEQDMVKDGEQNRVPMTTIRKRIAANLLQAKQGAAHVTTFNEVDMTRVMELRTLYRESFEQKHGIRLGFMSFFVKGCCNALETFPVVNAFIEGDDIVYNSSFNIGIAVSTGRGLIVPVIRNADRMGFGEIEKAIREFAARARDKKLTVDELTGGTFTITNGGVFGSMLSTPIPSPPQSAILGMHAIKERPVVFNGEIAVRPVMYVALTYDHRLIDGREAVSFLNRVKECIENPERILIDV
jgi:2-oxoglutarate dehydrogenase E2 component (dihydrolipoamide succinyltransferase)